ncbi:MAG: hypothetical protein LBR82_10040 [Desulfovibrio sp.]|jgi:hypothetical protein|nr:hypothetical protein [Desulfovibrio sp.]
MTLTDIQHFFSLPPLNPEGIRVWLLTVGVSVLVVLVVFVIKLAVTYRTRRYPGGFINDEKTIRNILNTAFDQRATFEVQVKTAGGQRRPTLSCAPDHLGSSEISLELNGLKSLSDKWIGRDLAVFFRIKVNKEIIFYTFTSAIAGIKQQPPGICYITLPLPQSLENKQKRAFLRISPPPSCLLGSAIWHNKSMPMPDRLHDISLWPSPCLLYLPGIAEQFVIVDLSAGGARLGLSYSTMNERHLQFNAIEQLILMVDLLDPENDKRLRLWLHCRIQSVWVDHASRMTNLGLQCLAWARPREHAIPGEPGSLEWLRVSLASDIEPLGKWIMRRHIELFREHPI